MSENRIDQEIQSFDQKNNRIRRTALSVAIAAAIASPAYAQDLDDAGLDEADIEEIVVTGVRQSLSNARAIKRDATTFVDAISATDIGALPDVSVLEALQRVPGIAIERFAAPDDPDHFSTEGSGATLRGLPQTRSSFNGRDTFSANSSRGLSYQDVTPELMSAVKVFKNQTADMIEGGISGTIDLNTRKPFDAADQRLAFAAQANYGDISGETTPSLNGLYSDRFDLSGGGEIGVLFSYSNSQLDFRSDGVEAGVHLFQDNPGDPSDQRWVPINSGIRSTVTEREREAISVALQFANASESFLGTFEFVRSDSTNEWLEHAFFSDDNGASSVTNGVFSNSSLVSGTLQNIGAGLGPQTRQSQNQVILEDYSLNVSFDATDRLSLSADIQYVDATTDLTDLSVFAGLMPAGGGIDIGVVGLDGDVPVVSFEAPPGSTQSSEEYFLDPANYYWRAAMDHYEVSEGDSLALRLDAEYDLDSSWAQSIEAGVRFAERDQTTRWSNYNWGNLSESWAGGNALFDGTRNGLPYGSTAYEQFSFDDFHGGNAGGIAGQSSGVALFPAAPVVSGQGAFEEFATPFGYTPAGGRGGTVDGGLFTAPEINKTNEQNTALYVKLNFGTEGERRVAGNVGLRWVSVDTSVAGGVTFPTLNANVAAFASPEELAFANSASSTEDSKKDFSKVLPSLNVKYELAENVYLRFAYSMAVAFPDLGNLRYNYNMNARTMDDVNGNPTIIGWTQNSGNPFLDPMEADNFDFSAEWYFGDSNFLAAGVFYKDITNFFATDTVPTTVTNPSTGQAMVVDINQPINIGNASLTGFEFSYQQFFDELPGAWSGLGMQFNYTHLNDSNVPQQNNRPVQADDGSPTRTEIPFTGLPLQGLSENTYNIVGMFQNNRFEGRLAYNWRDDYLLTIRQVNLGLPVFVDARGQLDGSAFFRFNENWQIGVQASNLLKDETVTSMQVDQAGTRVFRSSFVFDRRLAFIVRGKF